SVPGHHKINSLDRLRTVEMPLWRCWADAIPQSAHLDECRTGRSHISDRLSRLLLPSRRPELVVFQLVEEGIDGRWFEVCIDPFVDASNPKYKLHLHPHAADAAAGEIAVQALGRPAGPARSSSLHLVSRPAKKLRR